MVNNLNFDSEIKEAILKFRYIMELYMEAYLANLDIIHTI
jgi:hypothetical protein